MNRFFVFTAAAALLALLIMSLLADNGAFDLYRLRSQREQLQEKNAALVRENARLLRRIERLQNDAGFIENVARRELGMIGIDDRILKLPSMRENDSGQGGTP